MCFLPGSKSQISEWFIHEGRPIINFREFSFSTSPDTCLNQLQVIRFHWELLSPTYLILWWCFPGENSIWISLNKTHGWFSLTLITWNFSKHTGAKHQADTLNTGGNMCSFRREAGTQQGTITIHVIIGVGCWEKATHSNWEARRNCLNSTADIIVFHTFAESDFTYYSGPPRHAMLFIGTTNNSSLSSRLSVPSHISLATSGAPDLSSALCENISAIITVLLLFIHFPLNIHGPGLSGVRDGNTAVHGVDVAHDQNWRSQTQSYTALKWHTTLEPLLRTALEHWYVFFLKFNVCLLLWIKCSKALKALCLKKSQHPASRIAALSCLITPGPAPQAKSHLILSAFASSLCHIFIF